MIKSKKLRCSQNVSLKEDTIVMKLRKHYISKWKPAIKNGQQKNIHKNIHKHTQKSSTNNKIFYHRVNHPKDITNATIQRIYHQCFQNLLDFQKLNICQSRPRNLQDILILSKVKNIPLKYPRNSLQKIEKIKPILWQN